MLEIVVRNYEPLIQITIYIILFLVLNFIVFYKNIKSYLLDNWDYYKNRVWILPISGFIKPMPNKTVFQSTIDNFRAFIWRITQSVFNVLMLPIYSLLQAYMALFNKIQGILDKLRYEITIIRNFLMKLFEDMYIRIDNTYATLAISMLKLRDGMKRSYGIMNLILSVLEHNTLLFKSIIGSPINKFGGIADKMGLGLSIFTFGPAGIPIWKNSLCFHPNTQIVLNNNNYVPISKLKLGDVLKNGNIVLSIITSEVSTPMYNLNNVIVSGDHRVYVNNTWKRVKDVSESYLVEYDNDTVICLITSDGIIDINDLTFSDYLDTHNIKKYQVIRKTIDYFLNTNKIELQKNDISTILCIDFIGGLPYNTEILNINDVTGHVLIHSGLITIYNYKNTLLSGNSIVYENGKWIRVCESAHAEYIGLNNDTCINYITKYGYIILNNNIIIRDFVEFKNETLAYHLDQFVDN